MSCMNDILTPHRRIGCKMMRGFDARIQVERFGPQQLRHQAWVPGFVEVHRQGWQTEAILIHIQNNYDNLFAKDRSGPTSRPTMGLSFMASPSFPLPLRRKLLLLHLILSGRRAERVFFFFGISLAFSQQKHVLEASRTVQWRDVILSSWRHFGALRLPGMWSISTKFGQRLGDHWRPGSEKWKRNKKLEETKRWTG